MRLFVFVRSFAVALVLGVPLLFTGCGTGSVSPTTSLALPGRVIHGKAHGGVFPIQGATVRLMETQSNGYGGAAKQLLQTTSDSAGFFTFPDTGWSCDANQFAYITVTSGHTSSNTINNNVGQIGIIGNCGSFLGDTAAVDAVEVFVSELSTIAAVYTLRGFISVDDTNAAIGQQIVNISAPASNNAPAGSCTITTPTSCVAAGLAHGFANAFNLVDSVNYTGVLPSGAARTAPPTNATAIVPAAMINTLGNILQSCVDSSGGAVGTFSTYVPGGPTSTYCGDLFFYATPPGGTSPTNTLEAALSMAQYPANNVLSLFSLQPRAVFFTPALSAAPNDLSLAIFYPTQNFSSATGPLTDPVALALDANDDVYVLATSGEGAANTATAVLGLGTDGLVLFAGPLSSTYLQPRNLATDTLGNIWLTNDSVRNGALLKVNSFTGALTVGTTMSNAAGLAVDRFNNVWASVDDLLTSSMVEFTNASLVGGHISPAVSSSVLGNGLTNLAIDGQQNIWSLSPATTNSTAIVYANYGTRDAPNYGLLLKGQNLSAGYGSGAAFTSSNETYFPLANQLDDALYSGTLKPNNLGTFTGAAQNGALYNLPNQAEVDGDGNVYWTDLETNGHLFQFTSPASGTLSQGSLQALLPCYPISQVCYAPAVANTRGLQIDSTGALWFVADANLYGTPVGLVVHTFGVGAPTWPQLSLGRPGVRPQ